MVSFDLVIVLKMLYRFSIGQQPCVNGFYKFLNLGTRSLCGLNCGLKILFCVKLAILWVNYECPRKSSWPHCLQMLG